MSSSSSPSSASTSPEVPADVIDRAVDGDEAALAEVVSGIQHRVYNLAIRMLGQPPDAEDATQEIVLRVVTHLSSFRGESAFSTWVHRVALNHLIKTRQKSALETERTFDGFGDLIDQGIAAFDQQSARQVDRVMRNEVRLACTHGMLVCLDRQERAAFIVGAILELSGAEAAEILEVEPSVYRKRLSRGRAKLEAFMERRCSLYRGSNPCSCTLQAPILKAAGALNIEAPTYSSLRIVEASGETAGEEGREFMNLMNAVKVIDSQPHYAMPGDLMVKLRAILHSPAG